MNELSSKTIPSLSELQDQLDVIDMDIVCFFKLSLFKDIPPDYTSIHEFFTQYVYDLIRNEKKVSFHRFFLVFSFYAFNSQFLEKISSDLKKLRNRWLLTNCNIAELYGLDAKASQHYFQSLEAKRILEYISNFSSIDDRIKNSVNDWIKSEYKKVRLQLFFSLLKNNSHFLIFWFAIFFFFVLCLVIAAQRNSFTVIDQVWIWMHFILGKSIN